MAPALFMRVMSTVRATLLNTIFTPLCRAMRAMPLPRFSPLSAFSDSCHYFQLRRFCRYHYVAIIDAAVSPRRLASPRLSSLRLLIFARHYAAAATMLVSAAIAAPDAASHYAAAGATHMPPPPCRKSTEIMKVTSIHKYNIVAAAMPLFDSAAMMLAVDATMLMLLSSVACYAARLFC